jgi:hypothetical protein
MEDPTTPWFVADMTGGAQHPVLAAVAAGIGVAVVVLGALLFGPGERPDGPEVSGTGPASVLASHPPGAD